MCETSLLRIVQLHKQRRKVKCLFRQSFSLQLLSVEVCLTKVFVVAWSKWERKWLFSRGWCLSLDSRSITSPSRLCSSISRGLLRSTRTSKSGISRTNFLAIISQRISRHSSEALLSVFTVKSTNFGCNTVEINSRLGLASNDFWQFQS